MVVYDQSTRDVSVLAADSFLSILLSKLDGCFASVAILTGEPPAPGPAVGWLGSWASVSALLSSKPRDQCLQGSEVSATLEFSDSVMPSPGPPHFAPLQQGPNPTTSM